MSAEPKLPAVGSLWLAKDGRRIRVEEWTRPVLYPQDDYWARCTVLNPSAGQRHSSTFALKRFDKFLQENS